MEKRLKVGIAGYGSLGKVRHRVCKDHPLLEVVAVSDISFLQPKGVMQDGVRFYQNYNNLFTEDLDILIVCLPNYLAASATISGLEKKLHVFCEKPPGKTVEDILSVIECEKKYKNLKLMYGFNHRFHDSVQDALKVIKGGLLGDVIDLKGVYGKSKIIRYDTLEWRTQRSMAGGGILLDQGIHMLDMMRLFAGEFVQVHSFISNRHWGHDVEDNAYAMMITADKKVAMIHSSATQWRHRFQLDITLSKGAISLSGILTNSRSYGAEKIKIVYAGENDGGDPREQITRYNTDHSWSDEINQFVNTIEHDLPIASGSSEEALKTMELVYKIYQSDTDWSEKYIEKEVYKA